MIWISGILITLLIIGIIYIILNPIDFLTDSDF